MQIIDRIFNFHINSSIHVSLAVVSLAWITAVTLDISVDCTLLFFLFCSSVTGYNFVKYAKVAGLHHRSLTRSLRGIQIFSILCGIGMLSVLVSLRIEVVLVCFFLGLVTLFYAVPLFSKKRNLRSIGGIKIFVITIVWAGVTVVIPVVQSGLEMYGDAWVVFVQRLVFILAIMIPFEIRDLKYDHLALQTLPQQLGVKLTKYIGLACMFLFTSIFYFMEEVTVNDMTVYILVAIITGIVIIISNKINNRYYASFWVEGIPLLWLLFELIKNHLN